MFIHLISGLIFVYLFCRLILPLKAKAVVTVPLTLLLLAVSQQHMFNRYVMGSMASPELPELWILIQGWLFATLLFVLLICLVWDVVLFLRFLARRITKKKKPEFSPGRRQALMLIASALPAAYGVRQAVILPEVRNTEVILPRLPKELDGLRIAQLTDLHVSSLLRGDRVSGVVELTNSLKPDIIVFTGDIVDGLPVQRASDIRPLKDLKAPYGVYSCAGNHEYYSDYRGWMKIFPTLGLEMLLNAHRTLTVHGQQLVLAGTTDIAAARFDLPLPDCAAALEGAPKDAVRVLLHHRPGDIAENSRHGVDLQLSGHTHGGHMFGMDQLVARANNGYVYGWYKEGPTSMYVCSGAGLWNGFPVRIGVPSEIAHITLRSA